MSFDRIVETIIKEAMARGEFANLPGTGRRLDLTTYFNMPEEVRPAYSILKNAGIMPREAELLKEIAELKQVESALVDEMKRLAIRKEIEQKQIEFNLMMEGNHKKR